MTKTSNSIEKQFEALFKEHFTGLCYFAQKYVADMDTCKEIVHAVFVKIWENREEFDFNKPAKSYLFTSVYNRSLNVIRDKKKFATADDTEENERLIETGEFSDTMEVAELEGRIKSAIQKLPEKCREVFELNRYEGKKYAEIAEQLNISIKTVEAQMSKALKILRVELQDYLYVLIIILLKNNNWL